MWWETHAHIPRRILQFPRLGLTFFVKEEGGLKRLVSADFGNLSVPLAPVPEQAGFKTTTFAHLTNPKPKQIHYDPLAKPKKHCCCCCCCCCCRRCRWTGGKTLDWYSPCGDSLCFFVQQLSLIFLVILCALSESIQQFNFWSLHWL